ncbi:MAG: TIGR01777 family oxidoreductase [Acidobacteriaceae bacterium]|nr:TIGR01777 family oxidoreductase [Acidobacteriaceae bacterium]
MTYLVTGATGFIGTKLVEQLLGRGDAVYYLARRRSTKLPTQASFHPWETSNIPELNALSRIDAIFHLAGEPIAQRWTAEVKERIYDSRVMGTRNLVTAIAGLRHRPSVLVSASATGYYGDRGSEILTESEAPGGDFLAGVCKNWECEASRACELGLRVVPVRISTVLGLEGGALKEMLPVFRWGLGGKFGSGEQWLSWIHLEDLVRLLMLAADNSTITGPLNGSSPEPVTNAYFTKAFAHALHRPALLQMPKFAMKLLLGEMAEFLFTSLRVIPEAAEKAGFKFAYRELRVALQSLL